jgi:uroporphyrinogen-III synthase
MSLLWVITRALPDADADVAALRAVGVAATAVPCIERVPLPWPDWQPEAPRLVLVTSPFAATQLIDAWPKLPAPRPRIAAMAPATATRLTEAGIGVELSAQGGVVALAQAIREAYGSGRLAILYPTSDAGSRQPEQEEALRILHPFATVERIPVYSTRAPQGLERALASLPRPVGAAYFSPSAVEHASACGFSADRVACVGQSTYRRFCELAVQSSAALHYPSFGAFLSALTQEHSP